METSRVPSSTNRPKSWAECEQLDAKRYSKIDWREIMNLGEFVSSCTWRECKVQYIENRPCPLRCHGCKAGRKRLIVQAEYRLAEEAREKAAEEAKALNDRAEEENPGLYRQDKIWLSHAPGVALIRGNLLADIANFFSNCDIAVHEHNEPATNRSLKGTGADIAWAFENDPNVGLYFMRWYVQVRVQVVRFRPPPNTTDFEYPNQGILSGMKGAHGRAMCNIIGFLGSTGEPEKGNVDKESSYWFYSATGLKVNNSMESIGDTPFRMVRVRKSPRPDLYEMMVRFGLDRGEKRVKHFADNCEQNVREWKISPISSTSIHWGSFENVSIEPSDGDGSRAPELEDSSEDSDVGNLSDVSGSTDQSGIPLNSQEKAAIKSRSAEKGSQKPAKAQASREKRRAAAEADSEQEPPKRLCAIHRKHETQDEHLKRIALDNANLREKRRAEQAATELAEPQASRERTPAEAVEEEEDAEDEPRRAVMCLTPEDIQRGAKI